MVALRSTRFLGERCYIDVGEYANGNEVAVKCGTPESGPDEFHLIVLSEDDWTRLTTVPFLEDYSEYEDREDIPPNNVLRSLTFFGEHAILELRENQNHETPTIAVRAEHEPESETHTIDLDREQWDFLIGLDYIRHHHKKPEPSPEPKLIPFDPGDKGVH